ncbi:MAG: hypothetical protein HC853_00090 [Anaerolineae bacterium]|nr:hypothetical protein [Anaerolineae bacterium]
MTDELFWIGVVIVTVLGLWLFVTVWRAFEQLRAKNGVFTRREIERGLRRLGQLAKQQGAEVKLQVFGGGAMLLAFNARPSTKDFDVVIKSDRDLVLNLAEQVALEFGWSKGWLNDEVTQTLFGSSDGKKVFSSSGITVEIPSLIQLLASKLTAFRGGQDQKDAEFILRAVIKSQRGLTLEALWQLIFGHVGNEDADWAHQNLIIIWKEVKGDAVDEDT